LPESSPVVVCGVIAVVMVAVAMVVVSVLVTMVTAAVFCMLAFTQCPPTSRPIRQMFGAIALSSATEINRQNNFRTFVSGLMLLFR